MINKMNGIEQVMHSHQLFIFLFLSFSFLFCYQNKNGNVSESISDYIYQVYVYRSIYLSKRSLKKKFLKTAATKCSKTEKLPCSRHQKN